ncbi:MAG: prepilin-type N-terminal cleavage/methylation domain-containing protein [Patescibacteria group bacterium]|jgi:Tfp pilus assembly protein PilW
MRKSGFTLIELALYLALAAIVLSGSAAMISLVFDARIKDMVVNEVEQQGDLVLQNITQSIRNATVVNYPTPGTSTSTLSIDTLVGVNNPTIFSLSGGTIFIKEGAASAIALTNSRVLVSGLNFQNLAQTGANDSLRVSFVMTYNSSSANPVYQYSRTFYGSGSLRQ